MAQLSEIYPSYYNVLANPPNILDDAPHGAWDQYVKWRKSVNDTWKGYDVSFLPEPLMAVANSIADFYTGKPGAMVAFVQTTIRAALVFVPFGQTAAWAINQIIGFIFPTGHPSLWDQVKDAVEQMADQKFEQNEMNSNINALNAMVSNLGLFSNSIQQALGKPMTFPTTHSSSTLSNNNVDSPPNILDDTGDCDPHDLDCTKNCYCQCSEDPTRDRVNDPPCVPCPCRMKGVQDEFISSRKDIGDILHAQMRTSLTDVLKTTHGMDYMKIFLPMYVTAVSVYFGMFKSYIAFATEQNFEMGPNGNTLKFAKEFRGAIKEESEYVYGLFKQYLPDPSTKTLSDVNAYISYVRIITQNALDTVASWPLMDVFDYPVPADPQILSRPTFFDMVPDNVCMPTPTNIPSFPTVDKINLYDLTGKNAVAINNLFLEDKQLTALQFVDGMYGDSWGYTAGCYPFGFKSQYNDGTSVDTTQGVPLGPNVFDSFPYFQVINSNTSSSNILRSINLFADRNTTDDTDELLSPITNCNVQKTPCFSGNQGLPNHRIQAIYPADSMAKYSGGANGPNIPRYLTMVTPMDTPTAKSILTLTVGGIQTVPAELAVNTNGNRVLEYINGTSSLSLPSNSQAVYTLDTSQIGDTPQVYQVRVRAAVPSGTGYLTISIGDTTQRLRLINNGNAPTNTLTIDGLQGTYMLSPAVDPDNPAPPNSNLFAISATKNLSMTITNDDKDTVILDRIEFLPIPPAPVDDGPSIILQPISPLVPDPNAYVPSCQNNISDENCETVGAILWSAQDGEFAKALKSVTFQHPAPHPPSLNVYIMDNEALVGTWNMARDMSIVDLYTLALPDQSLLPPFNKLIVTWPKADAPVSLHSGKVFLAPPNFQEFTDPIDVENIYLNQFDSKTLWETQGTKIGTSVDLLINNTKSGNAQEIVSLNLGRGHLQSVHSGPGTQPWPLKVTVGFDTAIIEADDDLNSFDGSVTGSVSGIDYAVSSVIFKNPIDLEKITAFVQTLFTSSTYTELAQHVSSYQLDQAAMKVDALSSTLFSKEKMVLRKLVQKAKQLLAARNILINGDFASDTGWLYGTLASVTNDSPLFTCNYLLLEQLNAPVSSYAYQKIEEATLKPYTRYKVSGFVAESKGLELVVSRYGKEIDKRLNVPYAAPLPLSADANPNCCQPSSCPDGNADSHFFSYSIDVGALYPELNSGIEFGLRVTEANGMAKVGNLEIVEERPLTAQEKKAIQRKEQKWKTEVEKERKEISAILQPIINQLNYFFKNADWNGEVLPHVTYQDVYRIVLPQLPKMRHWFMTNMPGEHAVILQTMKQAIKRVLLHLEEQNLMHNGDFAKGLTNWVTEGDAQVIDGNNGNRALELISWGTTVSQAITISDFDEDKEYKLRVYGKGKGIVTVQHGEETETMSFNTNQFIGKEHVFYFDAPSFILEIQSECEVFTIDSVEVREMSDEEE